MAAIEDGMRRYVASPDFVRGSISRTKPLKDPSKIMLQASFRSAAVAAAVMDARGIKETGREHRRLLKRHALILLPSALGSLAVGVSLSLVWTSPFPLIVSLPLTVLAVYLDLPYRRSARLAEWNGIGRH